MNGFFSSVLSFLLGWVRAAAGWLWRLLGSESAGAAGRFLAGHWVQLALLLCAAGVAADLLVYFFRWRPDYVWATRLRRLRRRVTRREHAGPAAQEEAALFPQEGAQAVSPVAEAGVSPYARPAQSPDDPPVWDEPAPQADWSAQPGEYGAPRPEPVTYYHDVQAGFAPPVSPDQLYAPSPSLQAPLHPGLDERDFRRFGLQSGAKRDSAVVYAPAFRPFTAASEDSPAPAPGPLSRLAKRARSLVSAQDEDAPTVRDLQPTVDVTRAFHEPVYPQPMDHKEG